MLRMSEFISLKIKYEAETYNKQIEVAVKNTGCLVIGNLPLTVSFSS
jgi:hypothetical protein